MKNKNNAYHFTCPDPAKQITKIIDRSGATTPIVQALREAQRNGYEGNERFFHRIGYSERKVFVKRDDFLTNKLCIVNVDGDFLSPEIAKNNLITLANSGNTSAVCETLGLPSNHGSGVKVSYITKKKGGLLYRSKDINGEGYQFIIRRLESGFFGIQDQWCEEVQEWTPFPVCHEFGEELSKADSGTELVFLGDDEKEDTWEEFCTECSLQKKNAYSGHTIRSWFSCRDWERIGEHKTFVSIYDSNQKLIFRKKTKHLKEEILRSKINGCVDISNYSPDIPNGSKAYWAFIEHRQKDNSISSLDRGIVGFAWKKEVHFDHDYAQNIRYLKRCGIFAKPSKWIVVFEIPDHFQAIPSEDRVYLKNINSDLFIDAFRENLPNEIKEFLREQIVIKNDDKDIKNFLKERFKEEKLPVPFKSKSGHPSGVPTSGNGSVSGGSGGTSNGGKKRKNVQWNLKYGIIPEVNLISCPESPLVKFDYQNNYAIYVSDQHPLFKSRASRILKEFPNVVEEEAVTIVYKHILCGALSRIREIQSLAAEMNFDTRMEKCNPDSLEATWTIATESNIDRTLRRKNNERSSINVSEELEVA